MKKRTNSKENIYAKKLNKKRIILVELDPKTGVKRFRVKEGR